DPPAGRGPRPSGRSPPRRPVRRNRGAEASGLYDGDGAAAVHGFGGTGAVRGGRGRRAVFLKRVAFPPPPAPGRVAEAARPKPGGGGKAIRASRPGSPGPPRPVSAARRPPSPGWGGRGA